MSGRKSTYNVVGYVEKELDHIVSDMGFQLDMMNMLDEQILAYKIKQYSETFQGFLLQLKRVQKNLALLSSLKQGDLKKDRVMLAQLLDEALLLAEKSLQAKDIQITISYHKFRHRRIVVDIEKVVFGFANLFCFLAKKAQGSLTWVLDIVFEDECYIFTVQPINISIVNDDFSQDLDYVLAQHIFALHEGALTYSQHDQKWEISMRLPIQS